MRCVLFLLSTVLIASGCGDEQQQRRTSTQPDVRIEPQGRSVEIDEARAERAILALDSYGCTSCHTISGVVGKDARVGPPLDDVARRAYIAGVLDNTPENMVRWIRDPQGVDPLTAMPDLDVSERDARDITAWLYARSDEPAPGID